jgi:23S rRNA (cytosine1962-C5)-methyltransferase
LKRTPVATAWSRAQPNAVVQPDAALAATLLSSRAQVATAKAKRAELNHADSGTTGFRWVNGESDGLPGLCIDRYGDTVVAKIYTAAWLPHLEGVAHAVREELGAARLVLRLSRNSANAAAAVGLSDGSVLYGEPMHGNAAVLFQENHLTFEAEVQAGQKTGFFLDQRDNRARVEALAKGARVLNAFSFSGGFSLYAARGGAVEVTSLDLSKHALASAERNFALNAHVSTIAACKHRTVQADCFDWLAGAAGEDYDVVVLDPPCLAKRQAEVDAAIKAYFKLATLGLACVRTGGLLVSCSCSAHVQADAFYDIVLQAVERSGRRWEEVQRTTQPHDHPATIDEAKYLKCIYIKVF